MKPRNARESEALRLSKRMVGLTAGQLKWVKDRVVEMRIYTAGLTCWCTDCGHSWKERIGEGVETARCPHCGKEGEVVKGRHTTYRHHAYARFIQTLEGWQVIRYILVEWHCEKGEEARIYEHDVFQKWCQPGRPPITLGIPLGNMMGYCTIPFSAWGGPMSVKRGDHSSYYYEWMEVRACPRISLLPVYRKVLGPSPKFADFKADELLGDILGCPYLETLYKAKETGKLKELLRYAVQFHKYWPSVKVAVRHGYEPEHWVDWFDYVKMLRFLHYDLRSPRYVAPPDWSEIHERVLTQYRNRLGKMRKAREEKEALRRAIEEEERQRRAEEYAKKNRRSFSRRIAKFKDLRITDGELVIRPLMTITEFSEEGKAMHHCVFTNSYYNKTGSLILTARRADTDERVETVEVDLKELAIWQSRGFGNCTTEFHDRIEDMVYGAMPLIDKMAHPKRKAVSSGRS